jgi:hypothetical protein
MLSPALANGAGPGRRAPILGAPLLPAHCYRCNILFLQLFISGTHRAQQEAQLSDFVF